MLQINQYSETDTLKTCIIGRYEGYCQDEEYYQEINESQKENRTTETELKPEFDKFHQVLEDNGVEVITPARVGKFCYDQLTPRDIGVVIGDKFLICNMKMSSRRYEVAGIFEILKTINSPCEPNIIIPDSPSCYIEGGDIIVDRGYIFVADSQRTNPEGIQFLQKQFTNDFKVISIKTKPLDQGVDVLHLDCTFNPIGHEHALIYTDGFVEIPDEIKAYKFISITKEEQQTLATNILSLSKDKIISRDHQSCKRVNEEIRKVGIEVIEIPFNEAPKTGGSVRCCSLPLKRTN